MKITFFLLRFRLFSAVGMEAGGILTIHESFKTILMRFCSVRKAFYRFKSIFTFGKLVKWSMIMTSKSLLSHPAPSDTTQQCSSRRNV